MIFTEYRAMWKLARQPLAQRLSDKGHNWNDIKSLILNMTGQGLIGYTFTCPDMIGGYELTSFLQASTIDQELIVRFAQIHALMPMIHFSLAPWRILDKKHLEAVKKAVALREEFTTLIMLLTKEAAQTGEPIVRTIAYVFPNQRYETVKKQFLLGNTVLVAPIIEKNALKRAVLLPKGKWNSDDNKTYRSGSFQYPN